MSFAISDGRKVTDLQGVVCLFQRAAVVGLFLQPHPQFRNIFNLNDMSIAAMETKIEIIEQ